MRIREDGSTARECISSKELLRGLNVRDLRSLTDLLVRSHRSLPLLLPRRDAIVLSLCHIKALIHPRSAIVFNLHDRAVESWVDALSVELRTWFAARERNSSGRTDTEQQEIVPFELVVLEAALFEVTRGYQQRVRVYRPVVRALLSGLGSSAQAVQSVDRGLRRVMILKESLSDFQLEVRDVLQTMTDILENDEDMMGLLLTRLKEARASGEFVDNALHVEVEVLLEDYHRHLSVVENEAVSMMRNVKSRQELAAIAIDLHRSRLIRVGVYMSIFSLGAAVCTTIAGYIGMNVPILVMGMGLEANQAAFGTIVGGSLTASSIVMLACLRGVMHTSRDSEELAELRVLTNIFQDLGSIDQALRHVHGPISKSVFRDALVEAKNGRPVPQQEVDVLFNLLDRSGDGMLQDDEICFTKPSSRDI